MIDVSHFSKITEFRSHCRAKLEQQTPFAGLHFRHKEILLNNAECGPESDDTPQAYVTSHQKPFLCKQTPLIDRSTCNWMCGTARASKSV
jgi:hypothetical protein